MPSTWAACGWTSTANSSTTIDDEAEQLGQHGYDVDEREPELPGLTDEALELLEVAREELRQKRPSIPFPLSRWLFRDS